MNTRLPSLLLAAALSTTAFASLSAEDRLPQPVSQPSPGYPFDLRKAQIEGDVLIVFTVTAEGTVANPQVVSSSNWVFRDLTLAAIKQWKYTPALKDGRPVSVKVRQPFTFRMPEKDAERAAGLAAGAFKVSPATADLASNK